MPTLAEAFPLLIAIAREQGVERGLGNVEVYRNSLSTSLAAHLARLARDSDRTIVELMPGIAAWASADVASEVLGTRAINTLERAGIRTWGDLGAYSPQGIRGIRASGRRTTDELLHAAVEQSFRTPPGSASTASDITTAAAKSIALESLHLIATWGRATYDADNLGACLRAVDDNTPRDIADAFTRLMSVDATSLSKTYEDLDTIAGQIRVSLNDSQWKVFQERLIRRKPRTLEEIADDVGVTRERIRQVQIAAEAHVDDVLNAEGCRPLRWRAWTLGQRLGPMSLIDDPGTHAAIAYAVRGASEENRALLQAAVLRLAGPYEERDGWLRRQDAPEFDARDVETLADEYGVIPESDMRALFANHGIRSETLQDAILSRSGRFRRVDGRLLMWSGSVGNKAVGLLAAHGKPATPEALVEGIGEDYSTSSLRNALAHDERAMRVNRTEWGLRCWGMEEYSGLAQEIAQRIEERGGIARIAEIVGDMARLFDAKEQSVRTFCMAPMFVIDGQNVRLRRDDDVFAFDEDLSGIRGVFRPAPDLISLLMPIDKDVMRGSGKGLVSSVACALGVRPGQPRHFQNHQSSLGITWPMTSAFGASIGSIRNLSQTVNAVEGDIVRLLFDIRSEVVSIARVDVQKLSQIDLAAALYEVTGVEVGSRDITAAVADAIGVEAKDAYRLLTDRGDELVAGLLPPPTLGSGLVSALADLARILARPSD